MRIDFYDVVLESDPEADTWIMSCEYGRFAARPTPGILEAPTSVGGMLKSCPIRHNGSGKNDIHYDDVKVMDSFEKHQTVELVSDEKLIIRCNIVEKSQTDDMYETCFALMNDDCFRLAFEIPLPGDVGDCVEITVNPNYLEIPGYWYFA